MWAEFVLVLDPSPWVFPRVLLAVLQGHAWTVQRLPEGAYICFRSYLVELRPCCLARAIGETVIVIVIETLIIENIRFSRKMPMMPQRNYLGHRWGKTAPPKTVIVHTLRCRSSPWIRGAKLAPKWYYILLTD